MTNPLLVMLGNGEHARVVADAATAMGLALAGCIAPAPAEPFAHLGTDASLPNLSDDTYQFICAFVGGTELSQRRQCIDQSHCAIGERWRSVVHPAATISPHATIGVGVYIGPGAIVNHGAVIDDHAIINTAAVIEHDCHIGTGCHIGPASVIGGGTGIGSWTTIGLGTKIRDHITVGAMAIVGMGSVVIRSLPDACLAYGSPAAIATAQRHA